MSMIFNNYWATTLSPIISKVFEVVLLHSFSYGVLAVVNGRTSVSDQRTFLGLYLTCSWWVTIYMGKPFAMLWSHCNLDLEQILDATMLYVLWRQLLNILHRVVRSSVFVSFDRKPNHWHSSATRLTSHRLQTEEHNTMFRPSNSALASQSPHSQF